MIEIELSFSENWNNKLDCNCFSTIRLHNDRKYFVGNKMQVTLKGKIKPHPAVIKVVKTFYLHQLTEGMALLDTGYSLSETKKIIETIYKHKVTNINQQRFDFVILQWVKSEVLTKQLTIDESQSEAYPRT